MTADDVPRWKWKRPRVMDSHATLNGWTAVLFGGSWQDVPWYRDGGRGWHICDYSVMDGGWPHKCEPFVWHNPRHLAVILHSALVRRLNW